MSFATHFKSSSSTKELRQQFAACDNGKFGLERVEADVKVINHLIRDMSDSLKALSQCQRNHVIELQHSIQRSLISWYESCKHHLCELTLNPYSAGIDFSRQNLTSVDVRFWRLKSISAL